MSSPTLRIRRIALPVLVLGTLATLGALWTPDLTRATLESRYLASPSDLRVIDGVPPHLRDTGPRDAPVLLLLHGLGASLHTWEPWARALDSTFRVVRVDLPGSGLSAPDPQNDYSDARSLRLLTAVLDSLRIARAVLVGNSMGGRLAWSLAAESPERVERLVLISPDGFASPGFAYDKPAEVPRLAELMRVMLPKMMLRKGLEPAYADPAAMTDVLATRYHDLLRAPGAREAMLERMRQTFLTDPLPRLRRIRAPTLLLWGEQDAMIPISNAQDYLAAIPNVQLVRLPGLGHLPFEEAPAEALVPLRDFLARSSVLP